MSSKRKPSHFHLEDSPLRKRIKPLNDNQKILFHTIENKTITFVDSCAGVGKTYVSVYLAVRALLEKRIEKIIIARPAVECGRSMGHLPGLLEEKMQPYLIPIINILEEFLDKGEVERCIEEKVIEMQPLAFCRGLTFKNCYAILTEAQNSSSEEMLMFLTRLGENGKLIIEGDSEQSDLRGVESGFGYAMDRLEKIDAVGYVELTEEDIVRHPLIKEILKRWY